MNPRGIVSAEDAEAIRQLRAEMEAAIAAFQRKVCEVATPPRASIRETAKAAKVSPDTIVQWKKRTD